ncbi:MAG: T9SS type A sorting domain-containing protein [Ignavibacteriae bacterium]|nr:T9SS type A sorting domain-containing protein [Ignavibacteriota bacterium]
MKKTYLFLTGLLILFAPELYSQGWTLTYTNTGASTIYDLASSSSPKWIEQDPLIPDYIHIVIMSSPVGDPSPSFPGRRSSYYFSSDKGLTWSFTGNVYNGKTGFPSIALADDGSAVISHHGAISGQVMITVYKDAAPGLGSFTQLSPGISNYMFGKFCMTSSFALPVKVVLIGTGMTSDSASRTNYTGSGWSPMTLVTNTTPEAYVLSRGKDGRIGIAYMNHNLSSSDNGSVFFIESTDNGTSFSAPVKIFQPSPSDSLAAFRGIAMAYKNNTACVTFEIVNQVSGTSTYYMQSPAKIMFWCPRLPGSDPNRSQVIADRTNVPIPIADSIKTGVNDQFGSLSRPVIGVSADTNIIYVAFQAFTNRWGGSADTTNFKAIYLTQAGGNFNFDAPAKITPDAPLRDWSYPSLTAWNEKTPGFGDVYLCALSDSIPGTYVNSTANGPSNAQLYFIHARRVEVGIKQINGLAVDYKLEQNYPNPFNPSTIIRYSVSAGNRTQNVKLTVYDALGKEIAVLVNEKHNQGEYEVTFNAAAYPSGVYFYKLTSGNYSSVKRMVLVR